MEEEANAQIFHDVVFTIIPSEDLSIGQADGVGIVFEWRILQG